MNIEVRSYEPFAAMEIGFKHGLDKPSDGFNQFSVETNSLSSRVILFVESTETLKDLAFEILKAVAKTELEAQEDQSSDN
jgi:hypothetical protein